MFYIGYEDSGPSGPCGQTIRNTAPWRKLFIFKKEERAREFVDNIHNMRRIRPRILGYWSDEKDFYDEVILCTE